MTWWPWPKGSPAPEGKPPIDHAPDPPPPSASPPPSSLVTAEGEDSPFEFVIIDESGEGWGFDLNPDTVARPLAMASLGLFTVGALAGIPAGLALGRSADDSGGKNKPRPTLSGALFALRAFATGTALCAGLGAGVAYATAWRYDAWTWREFGAVMRDVVPKKREEIEGAVGPLLGSVRGAAADGLPGPTARAKDRFGESRIGQYIRAQIEEATRDLPEENESDDATT